MTTWLLGCLVGVILLAPHDDDAHVSSSSGAHGPSRVDLVGTVVACLSWSPVAALLWSWRTLVRGWPGVAAGGLGGCGLVLLPITLDAAAGASRLVAVTLLVAAQAVALVTTARRRSPDPGPRNG